MFLIYFVGSFKGLYKKKKKAEDNNILQNISP